MGTTAAGSFLHKLPSCNATLAESGVMGYNVVPKEPSLGYVMSSDLLSSASEALELSNIRNVLARLEDTIIFSLIERAQFAHNARTYAKDGFTDVLAKDHFTGSWLEWFLFQTETMHAKVRRFESPDEYPFTDRSLLPAPLLEPLDYGSLLYPNTVNVNSKILDLYISSLVPAITRNHSKDDDQNYGSSATRDLEVLQAVSRRVHYGKFVSESKFRSAPADFIPHILNPNPAKLDALITKPEVEAALLVRLEKKALLYGCEIDAQGNLVPADKGKMKIDVSEVVKLYKDHIIPLTKEVEVDYLLQRLDGLSKEEIQKLAEAKA